MPGKREAWFERRRFGGMRPIHWKGYVLMLMTVGLFVGLINLAIGLPERFNLYGAVRPACIVVAVVSAITLAIMSYRHSRPWRDRY